MTTVPPRLPETSPPARDEGAGAVDEPEAGAVDPEDEGGAGEGDGQAPAGGLSTERSAVRTWVPTVRVARVEGDADVGAGGQAVDGAAGGVDGDGDRAAEGERARRGVDVGALQPTRDPGGGQREVAGHALEDQGAGADAAASRPRW